MLLLWSLLNSESFLVGEGYEGHYSWCICFVVYGFQGAEDDLVVVVVAVVVVVVVVAVVVVVVVVVVLTQCNRRLLQTDSGGHFLFGHDPRPCTCVHGLR